MKRDRGICAHCGLNAIREQIRLKRARGDVRAALLQHWGLNARARRSLWDADHILPVAEGGGECDLDNIRTLCLRCHRVVTAQLRERIRRAKVDAMLAAEKASAGQATLAMTSPSHKKPRLPRAPGAERNGC